MIVDYVRLALATGLVLMPGYLVARAFGQRGLAPALAWCFATLFLAWSAVFLLHRTVGFAASTLAAIGFAAEDRPANPARLLLLWSLRLRAALFRGERGAMYAQGASFLASGDVPALLS